uniref:ATP synthase complex subunit 8 n=1 Tax=Oplurus grandidieri TaxID=332245 RepID=C4T853_9SAUR|nr:ATP synthase F0 subunit 8 [Oplurus grandidieri]BAH70373.1 ATPase subunit8 [Oplurus grandidieri]
MPQLNPSPWLFILMLTWLVLMTMFLNKTLFTTYPNMPTTKKEHTETPYWTWPWF